MNEQSLRSANDFLRVAAITVAPGAFFDRAPTEIGKDAGIANPLAVARAIRALAARRRVEMTDGRYRLLDATPLSPDEPESVPRTPRKRKPRKRAGMPVSSASPHADAQGTTGDRRPTYADLGRAVVDRLIELGRETGEALGLAENLRREVKENRAARIDAEQRASRYFDRTKELEVKLEMAEANLRTVLAAARGRGATAAPADNEMEAVLRVLKGSSGNDDAPTDGGIADGDPTPTADAVAVAGVDSADATAQGTEEDASGSPESIEPAASLAEDPNPQGAFGE